MKRIIALALAALLLMGLGLTALAEEVEAAGTPAGTITFYKHYDTTDGKTYPEETLKFTVTADSGNPDKGAAVPTVADLVVSGIDNDVTVSYPSFTKAGVYKFTIKEEPGDTQGVTYATGADAEINISILVSFAKDGSLQVEEAGVDADAEGNKKDTITNKYEFGGDEDGNNGLKVTKAITGNLADPNKYFTIKVTLKAEKPVRSTIEYEGGSDASATGTIPHEWTGTKEVTIKIKADETVAFNKIPIGVTYEIEEDASHLIAGTTPTPAELNGDEGYIATYENKTGTVAKDSEPLAKVTNEKKTEIVTGITLETLPYILVMALVVAGVVLMLVRRRRRNDD